MVNRFHIGPQPRTSFYQIRSIKEFRSLIHSRSCLYILHTWISVIKAVINSGVSHIYCKEGQVVRYGNEVLKIVEVILSLKCSPWRGNLIITCNCQWISRSRNYPMIPDVIKCLSCFTPHFAGGRVHVCKSFLVYVLYREELDLGMDLGPATRIRILIFFFQYSKCVILWLHANDYKTIMPAEVEIYFGSKVSQNYCDSI